MVDDATGSAYTSRCVYTEITPPELIAWTDLDHGMTTTTTLIDLGDGRTEMRIHQTDMPEPFATPEAQAAHRGSAIMAALRTAIVPR